uniref:INO80 complex subunit F domain-containing protein n=1 Tax=Bactrocera dorsalis TaxID=27457 RepID=A0A034WT17_BACDO
MLLDEKVQKYKLLAEKIYERCQELQIENERCVLRINTVKKLLRRRTRDVELLKRRLDKHNDIWRQLPMVAPHPKRKIEQKRGPKPKPKNLTEEPTEGKVKKVRKQRMKKNPVPQQNNADGITQPLPHFSDQQEKQLLLQQQFVQYKQDI